MLYVKQGVLMRQRQAWRRSGGALEHKQPSSGGCSLLAMAKGHGDRKGNMSELVKTTAEVIDNATVGIIAAMIPTCNVLLVDGVFWGACASLRYDAHGPIDASWVQNVVPYVDVTIEGAAVRVLVTLDIADRALARAEELALEEK